MPLEKVQGLVIKSINIGESDKILTILCDKLGKIDAVAHNCRRPKNKLMAVSQLFCFGEYILYKGRNLYTISDASINESFQKILFDYNKIVYASYFAELIDYIAPYEMKNVKILSLFVKTLFLLSEDENVDMKLLRFAVDFKAISIAGYMPNIKCCTKCSKIITSGYFSIEDGGIICSNCEKNYNSYEINKENLEFLHAIKNIKLENLRNINYKPDMLKYLQNIITNYIEYSLERKFKSLNMFKN